MKGACYALFKIFLGIFCCLCFIGAAWIFLEEEEPPKKTHPPVTEASPSFLTLKETGERIHIQEAVYIPPPTETRPERRYILVVDRTGKTHTISTDACIISYK